MDWMPAWMCMRESLSTHELHRFHLESLCRLQWMPFLHTCTCIGIVHLLGSRPIITASNRHRVSGWHLHSCSLSCSCVFTTLLTCMPFCFCYICRFGVTMWQLYTGLRAPYGKLAPAQISKSVRAGLRPRWPVTPPAEYASLAVACWEADRSKRPTSGDLVKQLEGLVEFLQAAVANGAKGWFRKQNACHVCGMQGIALSRLCVATY